MTSKHIHTGWQILLREWIERGMGNTGITLPFLVGALAIKRGKHFASEVEVRELIHTIVSHPVQGHFVGIRRCQNIQAPVLSLLSLKDPMIRKCKLYSSDGQLSIAFSPDAMSKISGLDCKSVSGCVEKLILHATPHAATGKFSRQFDPQSKSFIYTNPTQSELEFINASLM